MTKKSCFYASRKLNQYMIIPYCFDIRMKFMPGCHHSISVVINKHSAAPEAELGAYGKNMWRSNYHKGTFRLRILSL